MIIDKTKIITHPHLIKDLKTMQRNINGIIKRTESVKNKPSPRFTSTNEKIIARVMQNIYFICKIPQ